jgi:catalase
MSALARPFALLAGTLATLLGPPTLQPALAQSATEPPSAEAVVDAFEAVLGPIRTHRPSHAKGTCAAGHFTATPEGTRLSTARCSTASACPR